MTGLAQERLGHIACQPRESAINSQRRTVLYDFEVVKDGSVILSETIRLPHSRFAWPAINRLAARFRERGSRIRVKDQAGGIVILTGVAAVDYLAHGEAG
jgi:hypothetical protein